MPVIQYIVRINHGIEVPLSRVEGTHMSKLKPGRLRKIKNL